MTLPRSSTCEMLAGIAMCHVLPLALPRRDANVVSIRINESEVFQTPRLQLDVFVQGVALSHDEISFFLQVIDYEDDLHTLIWSAIGFLLLERIVGCCFDGADEDVVPCEVRVVVDVLDQGKVQHLGVKFNE